jgi:hypothetical protein
MPIEVRVASPKRQSGGVEGEPSPNGSSLLTFTGNRELCTTSNEYHQTNHRPAPACAPDYTVDTLFTIPIPYDLRLSTNTAMTTSFASPDSLAELSALVERTVQLPSSAPKRDTRPGRTSY